jgi:hypothetical protein
LRILIPIACSLLSITPFRIDLATSWLNGVGCQLLTERQAINACRYEQIAQPIVGSIVAICQRIYAQQGSKIIS